MGPLLCDYYGVLCDGDFCDCDGVLCDDYYGLLVVELGGLVACPGC